MTTNYVSTFILTSPDSTASAGTEPRKAGSIAALQLELLRAGPYRFTSDDLLFEVHVRRTGIEAGPEARKAFFAKSHACLRASPLVKQYGWGLHHDEKGRVAAYGVETAAYEGFRSRPDLKLLTGMRNRRS